MGTICQHAVHPFAACALLSRIADDLDLRAVAGFPMANNPVDPLQALQAALTVTQNSKEQADLLLSLRESLELQPAPIPVLVDYLLRLAVNADDSLLKRWILDLLHFAISRSTLSVAIRTQRSSIL